MRITDHLQHFSYHLLPGLCVLCDQSTLTFQDICQRCSENLPWLDSGCPYCGEPGWAPHLCHLCEKQPPPFSAVLAGFEYRFPIDALIHRFKDQQHLASGHAISTLACRLWQTHVEPWLCGDTIICPVPLHSAAARRRGFNQAAFIAAIAADHLGLNCDTTIIRRVKATASQKSLDYQARQHNMAHAFQVKKPLFGQRILLVDDVVTTTATIREIAAQLTRAGADDVIVLCLARTPSAAIRSV